MASHDQEVDELSGSSSDFQFASDHSSLRSSSTAKLSNKSNETPLDESNKAPATNVISSSQVQPTPGLNDDGVDQILDAGINRSLVYSMLERLEELSDIDSAVMSLALLIPYTPQTNTLYQSIHDYLSTLDILEPEESRIDRSLSIQEQGMPYIPDSHTEKHSLLSDLGYFTVGRYERLGEIDDLNNAIDHYEQAISMTPQGHEHLLGRLSNIGALYQSRFERLGKRADIDRALKYKGQALLLVTKEHEGMPALVGSLGQSHQSRYQLLQEVLNSDCAISFYCQAVSLVTEEDPRMPIFLSDLSTAYEYRFGQLGNIADIDNAITYNSQALPLVSEGHPDRLALNNNLGSCLRQRFEHLGKIADINKSIELHIQAVSLAPDGHTDKPTLLRNLAAAYQRRFERLGELTDIEHAIARNISAVKMAPEGHPDRPRFLDALGCSYHGLFQRRGEVMDIENAIAYHSQAVLLTPEMDSSRPKRLSNLGTSHMSRFERLGSLSDLSSSIEFRKQAVSLSSEQHPDMPVLLLSLAVSYHHRFERLAEPSDLNAAIDLGRRTLSLTPGEHVNKLDRLDSLGSFYLTRFDLWGNLSDIDRALAYYSQTVSAAPDNHACMSRWLNNLGASYIRRFERLGNLSDIDSAIDYGRRAILLSTEYDQKPGALGNLGTAYYSRFKRMGELDDIDSSIEYQTQAVSLTPEDHIDRPTRLNNLGIAHRGRFERLDTRADIDRAVECKREAVLRTPQGHIDLPSRLNNLGSSLEIRFKRLGELLDINEAIICFVRAVSLTPKGHALGPVLINNLGESYRTRFEHLGESGDIENSIKSLEQAVRLIPEQHAERSHLLNNLGISYQKQGEGTGDRDSIEKSIACFQEGAQSLSGSPLVKFKASCSWATLSSFWNISTPLEAYRWAMAYIPRIVWVGTTISRRYQDVISIKDVPVEAAATAIALHEHYLALEWLEEGRSIVWGQIVQLRTPLQMLASVDGSLAGKLYQAARELEQAGAEKDRNILLLSDASTIEQTAQQHHRLAEKWDQLVDQARLLPGLRNFLQPKKAFDLLKTAHSSAVVVVNLHESRCDALVLKPNATSITHVALPTFSYQQAVRMRAQMTASLQCADVRTRNNRSPFFHEVNDGSVFEGILADLWVHVVKPILNHLGYLQLQPVTKLPRVTWCTTGPLTSLPIHAAGNYDEPHSKIFNYVISSYTPNLQTLLATHPNPTNFSGILAVGQANATSGGGALPGTVKELTEIENRVGGLPFTRLDGEKATPDAVLAGMKLHSWVHLACHATQNPVDPTKSAFQLHNGTLNLRSISQNSFKHAGLAFLSACQTATGDEKLPEEAIHLAAGMILAGYPTVIATMWSIKDSDAPLIAAKVYERLLEGGVPDTRNTANALHEAVECLRGEVGEKSFVRWVPYIHIGI